VSDGDRPGDPAGRAARDHGARGPLPGHDTEATDAVVAADTLARFIRDVFVAGGMAVEHAAIVADVLVWANLRGVDSHGVVRVPRYVELLLSGQLNGRAVPRVVVETSAAVLVDADRAAGPVAMTVATTKAMEKARAAGIGLALVRATTHTGAIGYYTLQAAEAGMAALAVAASPPLMPYHGTRTAAVATSPVSIAVPGGEHGAIVLDMATSVVSLGRLLQAKRTGQPIEPGWAVDADGNPTTDPRAAALPLPLGGPKGAGLALLIELITSVIAGNPILSEALERSPDGRRHKQNALALAIDIGRFGDPVAFRREVDRLVRALKALPRQPGVTEVLMPGERGRRTQLVRQRDGIPIPSATVSELDALARRLRVAPLASLH
jgi:LDH2 family malate/lactate/ureidoglycolate dehydrogenase